MSLRQPETGFKPDVPPRTHRAPPTAVRTIVVPIDGPVDRFAHLVDALDDRDYRRATAVRRGLFKLGWNIIAPRTVSWPGRRS
jgi:hypothetical protein